MMGVTIQWKCPIGKIDNKNFDWWCVILVQENIDMSSIKPTMTKTCMYICNIL